jgi:hypothetical protein
MKKDERIYLDHIFGKVAKDSPYDPGFVAKIQKSRQDFKKGKGTEVMLDELDALSNSISSRSR